MIYSEFLISDTEWKYATEMSFLSIKKSKRTLFNYKEQYPQITSEVINISQKAKIYIKVQTKLQ